MKKVFLEGEIKLNVDSADVISKDLDVFYNPKMGMNRSISVLLLKALEVKNYSFCLPMAGTGVRAIRFLKELPEDSIKNIFVNDLNPEMPLTLRENLKLNSLDESKLVVSVKDSRALLCEERGFDYIDIDPYGSPNPLLDSAINRISGKGILAVTATDTGALAGTYPNSCIRKYWAKPLLCPQKHEIGLRLLCRKVQLIGLQYNKALIPVLSYHFEHYYRIFFKVNRGKKLCNDLFKLFDTFNYDKTNGNFLKNGEIGPVYSGSINDETLIEKIISISNGDEKKFLQKLFLDAKINLPFFFDIHDVCEKNNIHGVFSCEKVIEELVLKGFVATRVHTSPYGIRTNAPFKEFLKILKN